MPCERPFKLLFSNFYLQSESVWLNGGGHFAILDKYNLPVHTLALPIKKGTKWLLFQHAGCGPKDLSMCKHQ